MTGFEIAGAVLAAIPLLISGLEHYLEGLSTVKNMQDHETVIENLIISSTTSLATYRTSCEELLAPLILPDNQFYDLLDNPQTDGWKDEELVEKLNARLGPAAYLPYKSAVKLLYKHIQLLRKKMDLTDGLQVRIPTYTEFSASTNSTI